MPRFFLDRPPAGDRVVLRGREGRHAVRVLRLTPGDPLVLFDGTGLEYDAQVTGIRGHAAEIRIRSRRKVDREAAPPVTVAVAPPRARKMAQLVRGCAELGAEAIVPLRTRRGEFRLGEGAAEGLARWRQIALEASKQSGRCRVTRIDPVTPLEGLLREREPLASALVASTERVAPPLARVLEGLPAPGEPMLLLIGPEGDFTPAESRLLREAGCRPFTLGPSILRVETAAVASLAGVRVLLPPSPPPRDHGPGLTPPPPRAGAG